MSAWCIDMTDEQGVVGAVMFDDARALKETTLVCLTLKIMAVATFYDTLQVACQLTHLARAEEYVGRAVVIEE